MTLFILSSVFVLLLVVAAASVLAHEVQADGYGHRSLPQAVRGWGGAGLPSAPYRSSADR